MGGKRLKKLYFLKKRSPKMDALEARANAVADGATAEDPLDKIIAAMLKTCRNALRTRRGFFPPHND